MKPLSFSGPSLADENSCIKGIDGTLSVRKTQMIVASFPGRRASPKDR